MRVEREVVGVNARSQPTERPTRSRRWTRILVPLLPMNGSPFLDRLFSSPIPPLHMSCSAQYALFALALAISSRPPVVYTRHAFSTTPSQEHAVWMDATTTHSEYTCCTPSSVTNLFGRIRFCRSVVHCLYPPQTPSLATSLLAWFLASHDCVSAGPYNMRWPASATSWTALRL